MTEPTHPTEVLARALASAGHWTPWREVSPGTRTYWMAEARKVERDVARARADLGTYRNEASL